MYIRNVEKSDQDRILDVMVNWWGGRDLRNLVFSGLFTHFTDTCFVVEENNAMIAFLLGYLVQNNTKEAYINWIGVHPDFRNKGIARLLYERFYDVAKKNGRNNITCGTSIVNVKSMEWHKKMGFSVVEDKDHYYFSKIIK